ncbi:MAG: PD40 domain-containing protein, partial [Bacteroidales bacterium]
MKIRIISLSVVFFVVLYQMSYAQENSLRQITFSDSTRSGFPDWSPDGNYIYYGSSNRVTCNTMRIPSSGGNVVRITDYFTQHTRCLPDGEYLVFDAEFGSLIQICPS